MSKAEILSTLLLISDKRAPCAFYWAALIPAGRAKVMALLNRISPLRYETA